MINRIKLRNFKCYRNAEFNLADLTVFCGNNSVGKSTAIQSILMAIQGNLSLDSLALNGDYISIGSYSDIHKRNEEEDTIFFELGNDKGYCSWGYDLDDLSHPHYADEGYGQRKAAMKEKPLALIHAEGDQCESIRNDLVDNFQYLSAERLGPKSYYPYSTQRLSKHWLGTQGEYAAQVLSDLSELGELPEGDPRKHESARLLNISNNIFEWMGVISPGVFIDSTSIEHADIATTIFEFEGENYRPINVGFGLSYSLPIVMALLLAKTGGLVIIENPEAHLHPKGQSYLGRLIALATQAGVQVVVETHSDHVINGMRLMPRLQLVNCKKMKIYQIYAKAGESEPIIQPITIDEQGELSEWPDDFFDQQLIDMDILMSGKDV